MPTPDQINARIDAAIKESTEKYEALRVEMTKPKYEMGEHYIAKCNQTNVEYLICLHSITNSGFQAKYFIVHGAFNPGGLFDSIERKATPSEVLEALKKEAAKRGLVKGASADLSSVCSLFRKDAVFKSNEYSFGLEGFCLDKMYIMIGGLWATPIAPVKEKTQEDHFKDIYETGIIDYGQFVKLKNHFKDTNLKITPNA